MKYFAFSFNFYILITIILNLIPVIGYTFISYHKPLNKEQQESERVNYYFINKVKLKYLQLV